MSSSISLLEKFSQIEMKPSSRISKEDQTFVDEIQKQYDTAFNNTTRILEGLKAAASEIEDKKDKEYSWNYTNEIRMPDVLSELKAKIQSCEKDCFNSLKAQLIRNICSHFSSKYGFKIDYGAWEKNSAIRTGEDVVNQILNEMDGFSFTDKAVQEIKEEARGEVRFSTLKVKGNKVSFEQYYVSSYWPNTLDYRSPEQIFKIFRAVSHFDNGSTKMMNCFYYISEWTNSHTVKGSIYDKQPFEWMEKFSSFKLYKNGKFELEFKSCSFALEFAREYLGYQGNAEVA